MLICLNTLLFFPIIKINRILLCSNLKASFGASSKQKINVNNERNNDKKYLI